MRLRPYRSSGVAPPGNDRGDRRRTPMCICTRALRKRTSSRSHRQSGRNSADTRASSYFDPLALPRQSLPCNRASAPHASGEKAPSQPRRAGRQFSAIVDPAIVRILAEPTPLGRTIRPGVRSGKEANGATRAGQAFDCREPPGVRCVSGLPPRLSARRTSGRRQSRSCESRVTVDVRHHAAGPR